MKTISSAYEKRVVTDLLPILTTKSKDEQIKLIWGWVKSEHISLGEFKVLLDSEFIATHDLLY